MQLITGEPYGTCCAAGSRKYSIKALHGYIKIYRNIFRHCKRTYAAYGMACIFQGFLVGEHVRLYAKLSTVFLIVYLCISRHEHEQTAMLLILE